MEPSSIQKQIFQPNIKLSKNAAGKYSWIISLYGDKILTIAIQLKEVNDQLIKNFPDILKKRKTR